ncbi:MAG: hypothetical protein WCZ18_03700 [Ottowia sp.]|nr:hypothetical protein [Ottowia sp.]
MLALFKANAQLQMSVTRLLQNSGHGWLQAAQHFSSAGLAETAEQIDELLGATNWPTLMGLPSEILSRNAPYQTGGPQALTQIAIREQILFSNGLQRALVAWRQAVVDALDGNDQASSFVEVMRQWGRPWTAPAVQGKEAGVTQGEMT